MKWLHLYMVSRIEKIMNEQHLTPALFADKIEISRSSLSHIFSGRNKPSLEIILKIHRAFPSVDLYWLLSGTHKKEEKTLTEPHLPTEKKESKEKTDEERIVVFFKDGTFKSYDRVQNN